MVQHWVQDCTCDVKIGPFSTRDDAGWASYLVNNVPVARRHLQVHEGSSHYWWRVWKDTPTRFIKPTDKLIEETVKLSLRFKHFDPGEFAVTEWRRKTNVRVRFPQGK